MTFFFKFVKHHIFRSSGQDSVPNSNEQSFKFTMSTYIVNLETTECENVEFIESVLRLVYFSLEI